MGNSQFITSRVPWHRRLGLRVGVLVACVVLAADLSSHFLLNAASPEASIQDLERVQRDYEATGEVHWFSEAEERTILLNSILFALAVAAFGALLVSRLATRRIAKLAGQLSRAGAEGPPFGSFLAEGRDEIAVLSGALNAMGARIEHLIQELEQKSEQQSLWTAQVAHDLRTPLTAFELSLQRGRELLAQGSTQDLGAADQLLAAAQHESKRMQSLTEDLLEVARLVPGPELKLETVPLGQLLRGVLRSHELQAQAKGIDLVLSGQGSFPTLLGDGERLHRALGNLVSNAIRFADSRVEVHWEQTADQIFLVVNDDGPGFPELAWQPKLTKLPLERASNDSLHLGLRIAALVAEAHGGKLEGTRTASKQTSVRLGLARRDVG